MSIDLCPVLIFINAVVIHEWITQVKGTKLGALMLLLVRYMLLFFFPAMTSESEYHS